jgi:hypothetical protein
MAEARTQAICPRRVAGQQAAFGGDQVADRADADERLQPPEHSLRLDEDVAGQGEREQSTVPVLITAWAVRSSSPSAFHAQDRRTANTSSSPIPASTPGCRRAAGGPCSRPEKVSTCLPASPARSKASSSPAARARAPLRDNPHSRPRNSRFSRPVRSSSTVVAWPASAIRRRTAAASRTTSWPSTAARPPSCAARLLDHARVGWWAGIIAEWSFQSSSCSYAACWAACRCWLPVDGRAFLRRRKSF